MVSNPICALSLGYVFNESAERPVIYTFAVGKIYVDILYSLG